MVKNLKYMVIRCDEAGEDLRQAIATRRNMVRTDGTSPTQLFFNRSQKQNLPTLNPYAKPFQPDTLIKKRDKLHEQKIKMRDQHSVIIGDLAPGQDVLTQDYLSGLWRNSAIVPSKREDSWPYRVKDRQGPTFIRGRRRLKAISPPVDTSQETSSNLTSVLVSRFTVSMQNNNRTLQAKLHQLPTSLVCTASKYPLAIQYEKLGKNTNLWVFYITYQFQPKHCFHSTDFHNFDHPQGLTPCLQHYIISSEALLCYQSNVISPGSSVSTRPIRELKLSITSPGSAQSAQGKNIWEESYQEGSKYHISHT